MQTKAEFKVLIADDEPAARRGVRQLLVAHPQFRVVAECRDGHEVIDSLAVSQPDVIFLDIQMPGLDGFHVIARQSRKRRPQIVFLTAFDQFAVRAFDAEAFDYLVKPVSGMRFAQTIRRLLERFSNESEFASEKTILVSTPRGSRVVRLSEIEWIEAADNYARIWIGNRSYLLRESLSLLEERIGKHNFVRAHRRALVRLDAVEELSVNRAGGLVAVVQSGTKIPISRRKRAEFSAALRRARA